MAGLAAARALADAGVAVEVIEASDRVGGRVLTIADQSGLCAELGPEYVHGQPRVTLDLLAEAGVAIEPVTNRRHLRRYDRLVHAGDLWQKFGAFLKRGHHPKADESAAAFLDRTQLAPADRSIFEMMVEGYFGTTTSDISMASLDSESGGSSAEDQSRVIGGYGSLVDHLTSRLTERNVPVRLGAPVTAVDWSHGRVNITAGDVRTARAAIVTVPIGVLHAGAIAFIPSLGAHGDALALLGAGQIIRIVFVMRSPVWRHADAPDLAFIHHEGAGFPTFWVRSHGDAHQLVAWTGGPAARALAGRSPSVLAARALDDFAQTLDIPRAQVEAAVERFYYRDYLGDPFQRGAYSYTRVGGASSAATLREPLGNALIFAGEHTDADEQGTVAAALASGLRAAKQAAKLL